jgi:hypothetical protein
MPPTQIKTKVTFEHFDSAVEKYEKKAGHLNEAIRDNLAVGIQGRNLNSNTPSNLLTTNNMLSLQSNMSKDIKAQLAFKKKLRMNSEEKLAAKMVEQANAAKYTKTHGNKYVRLGSGDERKSINPVSTLKKNSSQLLTSNGSGYSQNIDKSNEKYGQFLHNKKLSLKKGGKRVGSPVTENENQDQDEAYYENKDDNGTKMPKKNLRLGSGNNRKENLNHYPFPLTPLDKASNKPIDFDENLPGAKCQSTRNK